MIYTKKNIRFLLHGTLASFGAYFCMYAFRKPFTVATFEDISFIGIDYKILLIIAQVLGYMLSKFLGIRFISELKKNKRQFLLLTLILMAEISLVLFGFVPKPYNIVFMFLNGLPLGLIWGIVFSYLEGRKLSEILNIALCASFIVSSGVVKSVGVMVMSAFHVSEFWMPSVTGALFILPLFLFSFLLEKIPPPTDEDKLLRMERKPMTKSERKNLYLNFMFPIVILVIFYTCLTAFRDFRDNFSRELWDALGYAENAYVYSISEILIAICVLLILGLVGFIKNNYKAFIVYHYLLLTGTVVIGITTCMFHTGSISPMLWMVAVGFGLYICYVPFNAIFFDRMIATFKIKGNAGYFIYIADAFGYLGSIAVLMFKNFGQSNLSWLHFFIYGSYIITCVGIVITTTSILYFRKKNRENFIKEPYTIAIHENQN